MYYYIYLYGNFKNYLFQPIIVIALKCWECLPKDSNLCTEGYGKSVSCPGSDSMCIKGFGCKYLQI